jgi:hypothetical protein
MSGLYQDLSKYSQPGLYDLIDLYIWSGHAPRLPFDRFKVDESELASGRYFMDEGSGLLLMLESWVTCEIRRFPRRLARREIGLFPCLIKGVQDRDS